MGDLTSELRTAGSVALDANGNGTASFDPDNANQRWDVTEVSVQITSGQGPAATPVPIASLYVNVVAPGGYRGSTWSGNMDTWHGRIRIGPCDNLLVVFTGGIAGATYIVTVQGTKHTRRRS